jgi:hypothetical protein
MFIYVKIHDKLDHHRLSLALFPWFVFISISITRGANLLPPLLKIIENPDNDEVKMSRSKQTLPSSNEHGDAN